MANRKNGGRGGRKPAPTRLKVASGTVQPCQINLNEPKAPAGRPSPPAELEPYELEGWTSFLRDVQARQMGRRKDQVNPMGKGVPSTPQQFSMPSGGTGDSQRPAASSNSPNPTAAMGGSGKAAESKASGLGADAVKSLAMGGQTLDKMPVIPVESVPSLDNPGCLPGGGCAPGGSNVEATPAAFPRNAPTRAPVVGSGVPDKSANLAKIRRK